jgi:hypothetical protein
VLADDGAASDASARRAELLQLKRMIAAAPSDDAPSVSRYLMLARANEDGAFSIVGVPPGEYWVAAVDEIPGNAAFGEWQTPDVLSSLLPGARRLRVADTQPATTELRLMRAFW